ncbi:MAG TPA: hypothetical protein VJ830_01150 [Anaerolineales bacterium]|nr:hypothetical protein [Anaerolineales bacterium]
MANIYGNQFARGKRGRFDQQFVSHTTRSGKTIVAGMPLFHENAGHTERQPMHQAAVRDAAIYACFAENLEAYICKAQELGTTAYALAVTDWYGAPKVLEIDVDCWMGNTGEMIRVKARDNVMVASVTVVIRDPHGQILEMGEARQSLAGSPWWNYTTQSPVPLRPFPIVQAIAFDLPGNRDSFTIS